MFFLKIISIFSFKIDSTTLDPDPNWANILDPDLHSLYSIWSFGYTTLIFFGVFYIYAACFIIIMKYYFYRLRIGIRVPVLWQLHFAGVFLYRHLQPFLPNFRYKKFPLSGKRFLGLLINLNPNPRVIGL